MKRKKKKRKQKEKPKDPYAKVRRDTPPPGYKIGSAKYRRKKKLKKKLIDEGLAELV